MQFPSGGRALPGDPAVPVDRFFELSLLALVTSGYLAVLASGYLDLATATLAAAGLLLRGLFVAGLVRFDVPKRAGTFAAVAYFAFYPIDYAFVSRDFVAASVHLVFFLAVVKILTAQTTRDHVFVAVIAFMELLAASILSTDLSFFAFLALFLVFSVATFASGEIRRSIRARRSISRAGMRRIHLRLAGVTAVLSLGILTLMAGMFFLLPRTARAAFQHLVPERYHIPGFSNEMRIGEIGEIQQRSTPVLHVRMGTADSPARLKWRGNALSQFDGRRWFNPAEPDQVEKVESGLLAIADNPQRWRKGKRISYEVRLHSIATDVLFFAGTPEFLRIDVPVVLRNKRGGFRVRYGQAENLHYGVHAFLDETSEPVEAYDPKLAEIDRVENLLLPAIDRRIIELARNVTSGVVSPEGQARAIEDYLRAHYGYTTELPARTAADPLAEFLFGRRKGHCEYFSSAMAVMLRVVNIPARVVTGFQSGVFNPVSGWYIVRASDAHSWVEAWLPGRGWTTFDATPPSARAAGYSVWTRVALYFDAAETFWHEWVLNYNRDRQLVLASWMESGSRDFGTRWFADLGGRLGELKREAAAGVKRHGLNFAVLAAIGAAAWFWIPRAARWWFTRLRVREAQRGGARPSDATLLYERMLQVLRRRGYAKPPWTTPAEFVRQLPSSPASAIVSEFTAAYNDLRYGGNAAAAPRMVALLEQLRDR